MSLAPNAITICSQRFSRGTWSCRVLVGGALYEVDKIDLKLLREGASPAELDLIAVDTDAEEIEQEQAVEARAWGRHCADYARPSGY